MLASRHIIWHVWGMPTHAPPLTADQIIKALGGPTRLSQRLELAAQRSAIANWAIKGVPAKLWPAIARMAQSDPETAHITLEALEAHTFPAKSGKEAA